MGLVKCASIMAEIKEARAIGSWQGTPPFGRHLEHGWTAVRIADCWAISITVIVQHRYCFVSWLNHHHHQFRSEGCPD